MSEEPGWYPDPYFLELERYWDGRAWTEQCRSAETKEPQTSVKPRPPKDPDLATPSATAAKSAARSAAAAGAAAAAAGAPTPTPAPSRAATTNAPAAPEVPGAGEEPAHLTAEPAASDEVAAPPVAPVLAELADSEEEAPIPADEPPAPAAPKEDVAPPPQPVPAKAAAESEPRVRGGPKADGGKEERPPKRKRRRLLVGGVVAAVIVLAVVVVVLLTKGATAPAGSQVANAASATINQQYAQVDVDLKMNSGDPAAASSVSGFTASGPIDLASSLGSLTLSGPGNNGTELMVLDNQTIYLDPGGLVGQLVKNKVWVSATPDDLGATSSPSGFAVAPTLFEQLVGGPTTLLRQLEAPGVTATAGRSSIYQGTPVEVYDVMLSQQAINDRLNGLPSSLRGAVSSGHAAERVYLTTNGLVRAISVPITIENNGAKAAGNVVVGFSAWGTVADITAPPASLVVSWAQFGAVLNYTSKL